MNNLIVIDVSAVVHTGANSQFFKDRRYYNYPVGGIHYLMRQISNAFVCYDSIVLCFDSPTFRKDLNADYKSGRVRAPEVISQIESVYEGLMSCGIKCYKLDEYEADDIVEWATKEYVYQFDEIVIVGNDYDLCHSVRNGVRFKSIAPGVGCIHPGNFSVSVESGKNIVFNTISARKAFCGCKSDKIKGIKIANGMSGDELYDKFVEWLKTIPNGNTYQITSFWKTPLVFANTSGLFTEDDMRLLLNNVKLVYPAEKPEDFEIVPISYDKVNKEGFFKLLTLYNDFESIKCLGGKKAMLSEDDKQMLRDKASKLSNGVFAADHNLEHQPRVATKTLDLDSFTREY